MAGGYHNDMVARPPWLDPRTVYLHIPFCQHRCGYCDFAVSTGDDIQIELYLEAIELELAALGTPRTVETAFIGGGTPTRLSIAQLERFFQIVRRWFRWPTGAEVSIEATPESLDEEKCRMLAAAGISRVSIGVQSFQPDSLVALDRIHRSEQIPKAIEAVRRNGLNLSLDLIFAAPGSTLESWHRDLEAALAFAPDHLSSYGLTYETGTPLWKQRHRGEVRAVLEDDELAMYELAIDVLTGHGYEHYEVSNFAKPGHRCRHNERYWANEAYYGHGVGAARYVEGSRELNLRNTTDYIRKLFAGESPRFQSEKLDDRERAIETAAVQLRRADGIDFAGFRLQTGFDANGLFGSAFAHLEAQGLLEADERRIRLNRRGFCVADGVVEHLMKIANV